MANAILNIGQTGGQINVSTAAAPATPAAGVVTLYAGTDKALHALNADGLDVTIATGVASPITVQQTCSLVSTAIGATASAGANCAIVIGNSASAFSGATGTIVLGNSSIGVTGACNSVVIGNSAIACAESIAIGTEAKAINVNADDRSAIAIGKCAISCGRETIAIGCSITVSGVGGIGIGTNISGAVDETVIIGRNAAGNGNGGVIAIGGDARGAGNYGIAIGLQACIGSASPNRTINIGAQTTLEGGDFAINLGSGSSICSSSFITSVGACNTIKCNNANVSNLGTCNTIFPGATGTIVLGNSSVGGTGACNSVVIGNSLSTVSPKAVFIGGTTNVLSSTGVLNTIINGTLNCIVGAIDEAVIIGGSCNKNCSTRGGIYSSLQSTVNVSTAGVIIGGQANCIQGGYYQIVLGGSSNTVGGVASVVLGGSSNTINNGGNQSAIIAGQSNCIGDSGDCAAIIGGISNTVNYANSVIIGGSNITADSSNTVFTPNLKVTGQAASIANTIGSTGGTVGVNFDNSNVQTLTLTDNATLTKTNPIDGGVYTLFLTQGGSGGYTVDFGADVKFAGGTGPTLSTAIGATDAVSLVYIAGVTGYFGNANLNFA